MKENIETKPEPCTCNSKLLCLECDDQANPVVNKNQVQSMCDVCVCVFKNQKSNYFFLFPIREEAIQLF